MVPVTARLEGRDLGSAMADVEQRLAGLKLPRGYSIELGGQRLMQRSFRSLGLAIGAALALVLVVLVFQFSASARRWPSSPPCRWRWRAAAGAGGDRTPLNVSSLLGGILLSAWW